MRGDTAPPRKPANARTRYWPPSCPSFKSSSDNLKVERRGKRPSEHPRTGRAQPPRCLVRWQCDSPRLLITSRRSVCRDLGQKSAVSPAVSQPFLRRFSTQIDPNPRKCTRLSLSANPNFSKQAGWNRPDRCIPNEHTPGRRKLPRRHATLSYFGR